MRVMTIGKRLKIVAKKKSWSCNKSIREKGLTIAAVGESFREWCQPYSMVVRN